MSDDIRPHSRACGVPPHEHGPFCSTNCPTCHGKAEPDRVSQIDIFVDIQAKADALKAAKRAVTEARANVLRLDREKNEADRWYTLCQHEAQVADTKFRAATLRLAKDA